MRKPVTRIFVVALLALAVTFGALTAIPTRTSAGSLSTAIIGMFPKDAGEFAYADLKTARKYPWFAQLNDQLLPPRFHQFEQFLASSGVDGKTDRRAHGRHAQPADQRVPFPDDLRSERQRHRVGRAR